ncbi:MAG: hypothetical protein AAF750_06935 [Planctomycetota bacterium]
MPLARLTRTLTAALTLTLAATTAHAGTTPTDDLEFFTTNFNALPPGSQAPELGPASFTDPGEILFFRNRPFYVAASNRAWGFILESDADRSTPAVIDFATPAYHLILTLRGSNGLADPAQINNSTGQTLLTSDITVEAYDPAGNLVDSISNISNDAFSVLEFSDQPIGSVRLFNTGDIGSTLNVGEISFKSVPTPSTALLGTTALALLVTRRRRSNPRTAD